MRATKSVNISGDSRTNRFGCKMDPKEIVKKRLPITDWILKYRISTFLQDLLAGFTVALTEVPQGIAYAVVAGLPPVYGLYSGFMGGFIYVFFGSCKDINIGPTAIMALMVQPHVEHLGYDMAVLLTFFSGCIIFLLGLLHLGFLVEFFSYPIIAGFTSAAALNIACSQLNGLFGLKGKANAFLEAWEQFFSKVSQTRKWDCTLGLLSVLVLVLMKEMRRYGSLKHRPDWSRNRNIVGKIIFLLSLARNAIVVMFGTILAYCLSEQGRNPFILTATVDGGLPPFDLPPFSSHKIIHNGTANVTVNYDFNDMMQDYGTTIIFAPLIAILESIAIAKAFTKGKFLDATQELIALGLCNIMGSFVRSMPVTGSFTRTAVNNASGVKTTMAGVLTGLLVLLALQFLTKAFYYIPKATLASVVICAMFYLFDFEAFVVLWRTKCLDLVPFLITLLCCLFISLEYGILIGIATNLIFVLYSSARPKIEIEKEKTPQGDVYVATPRISLQFPAAEYVREVILAQCTGDKTTVVVNGKYIGNTDATVAKSLSILVDELTIRDQKVIFWNFKQSIKDILSGNNPQLLSVFREGDLEEIVVDDPGHDPSGQDNPACSIQI